MEEKIKPDRGRIKGEDNMLRREEFEEERYKEYCEQTDEIWSKLIERLPDSNGKLSGEQLLEREEEFKKFNIQYQQVVEDYKKG